MDVYIGLDVSLASTAICVLGEKGKIVTEAQVASAPESLVSFTGPESCAFDACPPGRDDLSAKGAVADHAEPRRKVRSQSGP